jgi:hypothetical protein
MVEFVKLITGEEIIAETIWNDNTQKWTLKNAVKLMLHQNGVAMIPISPFLKDETVSIHKDHIIFKGELDDEIKNAYNAKYGSGIVLPTSKLKIAGE